MKFSELLLLLLPLLVSSALARAPTISSARLQTRFSQYVGALTTFLLKKQSIPVLLANLGPAAIKVGQSLAARPDLVGLDLARQLQQLQDAVPASLSAEEVRACLAREGFDREIDLSTLSLEPVAAASLGQVHSALLLTSRERVAIKVQRPGIQEAVACDFFFARLVLQAIQPFIKTKAMAALDELQQRLVEEMDYHNEKENLLLFQSLYDSSHGVGKYAKSLPAPGVGTPRLFPHLCSDTVLTMSWVDGIKLVRYDELPKEDLVRITRLGLQCSLSQLLETGVVHADPHGGNLMVDRESGKLVYIDFGLVSFVPRGVRVALLCAVLHLVERDVCGLAGELEHLLLLPADELQRTRDQVEAALARVVDQILDFGGTGVASRGEGEETTRLPTLKFDQIVGALVPVAALFPFQAPPYVVNHEGAISMLEGVAMSADPAFNLFGVLYPFMVRRAFAELDEPRVLALFKKLVLCPYTGAVRWAKAKRLIRDTGVHPAILLRSLIGTKGGRRLLVDLMLRPFNRLVLSILLKFRKFAHFVLSLAIFV
jgi:predicted unusual protein kinase regulating ubiquinone biosynthesis (AarF/ABC1/UbiB family)